MSDASYTLLTAHLWDLRAHAESKLRCLTRVQQELSKLEHATNAADRAVARHRILKDLKDVVSISETLRSVATEALHAASKLPV